MPTEFSEIYQYFLSQIDDYELGGLEIEDLEDYSEDYLIAALPTILELKPDVFDIDTNAKVFRQELTLAEKLFVAKAMKLEWVKNKKYSEELMRKSIGDRDYYAVQGYQYLPHLAQVEKDLDKEIRVQLIRYGYSSRDNFGSLLNG